MAVRANRRRRRTRRKNGLRTTGALVVNPRRNRRRRKNSARRANPRRTNRKRRTNRRRRNALVVNRRRRTTRRRRNAIALRTNRRHRRRRNALVVNRRRRSSRRRNGRRAAPRIIYRYRNAARRSNRRRRRNGGGYRRNPGMFGGLAGMLNKIPVVGPLLSGAIGFVGPALFGALGAEPSMQVAKFAGRYVPQLPASLFYVLSGLLTAALVHRFAPLDAAMKQKLAIGIASATGGIAYYKWRTGQDSDMAGELGALEYNPLSGMLGEGYNVVPFGDAGGYGAIEVAYGDSSYGDAWLAGYDLSGNELGAARASLRSGGGAWMRAFPAQRFAVRRQQQTPPGVPDPSEHGGLEGHQWGWLIRIIGFPRFAKLSELPTEERQRIIADAKEAVRAKVSEHFASQQQSQPAAAAGWGSTHIYGS